MYYKTFALYLGVINYTLSNHYNLFSAQRHLSLKKVSPSKIFPIVMLTRCRLVLAQTIKAHIFCTNATPKC